MRIFTAGSSIATLSSFAALNPGPPRDFCRPSAPETPGGDSSGTLTRPTEASRNVFTCVPYFSGRAPDVAVVTVFAPTRADNVAQVSLDKRRAGVHVAPPLR